MLQAWQRQIGRILPTLPAVARSQSHAMRLMRIWLRPAADRHAVIGI
jgi:hypothetical protein